MPLTKTEKETLLKIARSAIESRISGDPADDIKNDSRVNSPALRENRGAFVSIHRGSRLRGCIGTFSADKPLFKTVIEMAMAAATQDPRFPPVTPNELSALKLEISALSPLSEIKDTSEIEIGRHGIYIISGLNRGVLLPQVAVENGFDRETFLDHTCQKAGLRPGCWRSGATILIFEAEIFEEPTP